MSQLHTIGEAAADSGVSAKMIRHYEKIGLIGAAERTEAGYRLYGPAEIHTLRFIRRARNLGFSVDDIVELLGLWHDEKRASKDVREVAAGHLGALRAKAAEILSMIDALEHLIAGCTNDDRPDCPILKDLSNDANPALAKEVGHKFGYQRVC
ncbi:MerR family DNA-binding protein [Qipengyuania sp. XHP0211]|uniref:MerR family DNA-binding protein n=1 Tax=Qipengyuania sp. XHP0211 TaxID=3038079 RepID=UPI00241F93C9|nr:MerR family DNA-binding protein [Qipengyuania sp. XHP0211]MDG5751478.1 MerR family DNA-binding protein [Qipengyuania sp. XHP0211]